MARIPGLIWRPLPENAYQPAIRPTQWIVHTAVDGPGPTDLGDYFERSDVQLESHTWLRWDRHEQFIDTEVRADANYLANRRAVSTETEDDGTPVQRPWNEYQLRELIRTGVEIHRLHGIPPVLAPAWDAPGMGYHSLYPGYWTNVSGKTCPGETRIEQFKTIVLPGIQAAVTPQPPPPRPRYTDPMIFQRKSNPQHRLLLLDGTLHLGHGSRVEPGPAANVVHVDDPTWNAIIERFGGEAAIIR